VGEQHDRNRPARRAPEPEERELFEMFVRDVPSLIESLQSDCANASLQELERLARQLSDGGQAYGYAALGEAAARLESRLREGAEGLEFARRDVDELIDLCNRAAASSTARNGDRQ